MTDLMLTKSGDLMFVSEVRKQNVIKLTFCISDTNACKLDFFIETNLSTELSPTQIRLNFDIDSNKRTYTSKVVTKKDFSKQACLIRLKTQLGELKYHTQIGSKIEEVKHKFLFDESIIAKTAILAKDAIKDIYPNATVTAEPFAKHYTNGYKQIMLIKVYDEDIIILEYELG